jgi:hypothetical protein
MIRIAFAFVVLLSVNSAQAQLRGMLRCALAILPDGATATPAASIPPPSAGRSRAMPPRVLLFKAVNAVALALTAARHRRRWPHAVWQPGHPPSPVFEHTAPIVGLQYRPTARPGPASWDRTVWLGPAGASGACGHGQNVNGVTFTLTARRW